jgi:ATP-dependent DNA helicase DinG
MAAIMERYIDQAFGSGGSLESRLPNYVFRAGQYGMAQQVDAIFRGNEMRGETLLVEGPTGTGKSLAYLVPLTKHASAQSGRRGLVVTANIALQEQLVKTDLPLLESCVPWTFKYALYKGKQNYLCNFRLVKAKDEMAKEAKRVQKGRKPRYLFSQEELQQQNEILSWADRTETGDKTELPFEPSGRVWARYSSSFQDCIKGKCTQGCWAATARGPLSTADVIVTNYYVFFTHLSKAQFLPKYSYVVLDEAHKMVDIAREFYGTEFTKWMVRHAITDATHTDEAQYLMDTADHFFRSLEGFRGSDDYKARLRGKLQVPHEPLRDALGSMKEVYSECIELARAEKKFGGDTNKIEALVEDYKKQSDRCVELAGILDDMANVKKYEDHVYFIEEPTGKSRLPKLCCKPVNVSTMLREQVFTRTPVIVTSATLQTDSTFRYVAGEMGVPGAKTYVAASPFTWNQQAFLVVPSDMPSPIGKERLEFRQAVMEKVTRIIELARGRTLALFTSRDMMHKAHAYAREHLPSNYHLLMQDQKPRIKLLAEFRENHGSSLFGTESFWAGVDVPGSSLSCVIMDKLPFKPPNDPIYSFYEDHYGREAFPTFMVPGAIIPFRQGFGRLIRTVSDYGIVVILDPRIETKSYGKRFFNSLPDPNMRVAHDIEKIPLILR